MTRPFLDRLSAALARLVLRLFFARIDLAGGERLPAGGPLLVVSNHGNALVDPMLLAGFLPYRARFLAKSTLWKHPVAGLLVRLGGAIPVYRRQDAGVDTAQNVATFERCYEVLADRGVIALFPEGMSHDEPRLQPLKTGAARIALEAEARHGPLGVRILPVGLIFDERDAFRSDVLIQIGEPIDPSPEIAAYAAGGQRAVRDLTERLGAGLAEVTLNYDSWHEAELLERAADLYLRGADDAPAERPLAERVAARRAFTAEYPALKESEPQRVAAVAEATESYDRLLKDLHLDDRHVTARYPLPLVAGFAGRSLLFLLVWSPLAALGTLLNWLPFRVPGLVTAGLRRPRGDRATYKLLMSLFLFPAFWIGEALWVASRFGAAAGWATLAAAPLTGLVALHFRERWLGFVREARAYLALKTRRRAAAELKRRRGAVWEAVSGLVALVEPRRRGAAPDDPAG